MQEEVVKLSLEITFLYGLSSLPPFTWNVRVWNVPTMINRVDCTLRFHSTSYCSEQPLRWHQEDSHMAEESANKPPKTVADSRNDSLRSLK